MRDFSKSEWESIIDEWIIGKNAQRDRQILKRRLLDGVCFEPLAEEFEMSTRQVQRIVYKNMQVIVRHLDK